MKRILISVSILLFTIYIYISFFHVKGRPPLHQIKNWGYQLQGRGGAALQLLELRDLPFELLVTDYSATGEEANEFSAEDIRILKNSGKTVISYLSIGEAEEIRFYYPYLERSLIEKENPNWKGNYKVYFWEETWKTHIFGRAHGPKKSYLDRIIDQGFDGIYLDIIDAYYYFGSKEHAGNNVRPTAAMDMIQFVEELSTYAKVKRGKKDFLIVVQNAPGIVDPYSFPESVRNKPGLVEAWQERYFKAIDAIGVEDLFFFGEKENNNAFNSQKYIYKYLELFQKNQKPVFSIEYIQKQELLDTFFSFAKRRGFIPLAAERSLDGRFLKGP